MMRARLTRSTANGWSFAEILSGDRIFVHRSCVRREHREAFLSAEAGTIIEIGSLEVTSRGLSALDVQIIS
jgi:hypothetical protein